MCRIFISTRQIFKNDIRRSKRMDLLCHLADYYYNTVWNGHLPMVGGLSTRKKTRALNNCDYNIS